MRVLMLIWMGLLAIPTWSGATTLQLRDGVAQPYIVQPGDTLWDIAQRMFADPFRWLDIWERNPAITNPDLIYPGDKIWFDPSRPGGLRVEHVVPDARGMQVVRLSEDQPAHVAARWRRVGDWMVGTIRDELGYIVAPKGERLQLATNDQALVRLTRAAVPEGLELGIYRRLDAIRDPRDGRDLGHLFQRIGSLHLLPGKQGEGLRLARIDAARVEIAPGDVLLRPAPTHQAASPQAQTCQGLVLHVPHAGLAAQHQIVVIGPAAECRVAPGTRLKVLRQPPKARDPRSGEAVARPQASIGAVVVVTSGQQAAVAVVTRARRPIVAGDRIALAQY